jgi:hypothetical protein
MSDHSQMTGLGSAGGSGKPNRKKDLLVKGGIAAGLLFVAIQFYPVDAGISEDAKPGVWPESKEVEAILRRSCFDCHSNEVTWPWYSHVAPMKWMVVRDVRLGREALNISEWPKDPDDQQYERENIWEIIEAGEMPPWFYIYPAHMNTKLSENDLAVLKKWAAEKEDEEEEEEDDDEAEEKADEKAGAEGEVDGDKSGSAKEEKKEDDEGEED